MLYYRVIVVAPDADAGSMPAPVSAPIAGALTPKCPKP